MSRTPEMATCFLVGLLGHLAECQTVKTGISCFMRILAIFQRRLWRLGTEKLGQDLIEYALMAGFVAVAAGAIFPSTLMPAVSGIFSKIGSYFAIAAAGG